MKANVKIRDTVRDKVDGIDRGHIMPGLTYHSQALGFILLHILLKYYDS